MWQSLYLCSNDPEYTQQHIAPTLSEVIAAAGYTAYDPFGGVPGKAYADVLRLFVGPIDDGGWLRIISEGGKSGGILDAIKAAFSGALVDTLCLSLALEGATATITAYQSGEAIPTVDALTPYLRDGKSRADLEHALSAQISTVQAVGDDDEGVPLSALPDDVQAMADKLNPKQINKMFNKFMGRVSRQLGGDNPDGESVRDLLKGQAPNWESAGGMRLRALAGCITLAKWRTPDFVTLRDAYQVHNRRRRNPKAHLYPGDAEAMQAVPDALAYVPVYGGKGV